VWHISSFGALIQTYKRLDELAGGAFNSSDSPIIDLQTVWSAGNALQSRRTTAHVVRSRAGRCAFGAFAGIPLSAVATSQTTGTPSCPAGFSTVDVDMNRGAGGTYSYLCYELATSPTSPLLRNVTVAIAKNSAVCEEGWAEIAGNIKAGTKSLFDMRVCVLMVATPSKGDTVVTNLFVAQGGAACPAGYVATTPDISGGVGDKEVICVEFATVGETPLHSTGALPRLPRNARWTATRPVDKSQRAEAARRRKPLE
jgi:hypothetical protein